MLANVQVERNDGRNGGQAEPEDAVVGCFTYLKSLRTWSAEGHICNKGRWRSWLSHLSNILAITEGPQFEPGPTHFLPHSFTPPRNHPLGLLILSPRLFESFGRSVNGSQVAFSAL